MTETNNNSIHFEISERKILLRILDLFFIGVAIYGLNSIPSFDYFSISEDNWMWTIVLVLYISGFGTIFELYDLQKSSRLETVTTTIILTTSVTVLVFLLTPFFTPSLPDNRLQILYFYIAILLSLLVCRIAYISFIASPRFYKKVLLVGEISNIETIVEAFKSADSNYKIIGFINCEIVKEDAIKFKGIPEYRPENIHKIIKDEQISEVVVASYNSENITSTIYNDVFFVCTSLQLGLRLSPRPSLSFVWS